MSTPDGTGVSLSVFPPNPSDTASETDEHRGLRRHSTSSGSPTLHYRHPHHGGTIHKPNEHHKRKQVHHLREPGFRKDFHQKLYKTPKETIEAVIGAAEHKASLTLDKTIILGIMAGMYVGLGGIFALSVSQNLPTTDPGFQKLVLGILFSFALVLIIFMGGELFTGNTMYMTLGVLSKKITFSQMGLNLVVVYFTNWAGCCLTAYFFAYLTELFSAEPYHTNLMNLAAHKLELSPGVAFLRAIPANWMVCVGCFLNLAAEDVGSKIIGMVYAVTCFAAIGFEHCIANMFYVDLALMYGLPFSFGDFIKHNLILVTLGNIVGGAFFVALINWYFYCTGTTEAPTKEEQKLKMKEHREKKLIRWTWK
eukprot:Phypoly_transcript_06315.p1 GENE.Phypoly_transcript_06315~~Phypoly_transcript_06315.p1  ORF type:complete len:366 (+),score=49.04 Phypoly_transcript_06315:659-1756(+)